MFMIFGNVVLVIVKVAMLILPTLGYTASCVESVSVRHSWRPTIQSKDDFLMANLVCESLDGSIASYGHLYTWV